MTRAWRFAVEHYLLLPLGAVIAVVWANTYGDSYFGVAQALAFAVNDIGMAFGLAFVAQEVIEATLPAGTLHPLRRAMLPIVAGIGGSVGATAVYLAYIRSTIAAMPTPSPIALMPRPTLAPDPTATLTFSPANLPRNQPRLLNCLCLAYH